MNVCSSFKSTECVLLWLSSGQNLNASLVQLPLSLLDQPSMWIVCLHVEQVGLHNVHVEQGRMAA